MCLCDLDPSCGPGFCDLGAYCTGSDCADPVCYAPDSPISMTMCQGVALEPGTCEPIVECSLESRHEMAGVPDNFSTANGAEAPSPSGALLGWIAANYPNVLGFRDFDDPQFYRYFVHTFVGLEPHDGQYICGAKLTLSVHRVGYNNDGLWLRFADANGNPPLAAPSWSDTLNNLGVPAVTPGAFTVDLASLPNGAAVLTALENGWLDVVLQDDTMVDDIGLAVDYCCP